MSKVEEYAYPRGKAAFQGGLMGEGPIAPGPGEVQTGPWDPEADAAEAGEAMAGIAESLAPQIERAERTAKREKEREDKRQAEAPFRAWLRELSEILSGRNEDEDDEGRNEIEFILMRVERNGSSEKSSVVDKFCRTPQEAVSEGLPDLEGMVMEYAKQRNAFGSYAWKIRAWLGGELVKQTTCRVNVVEPPNYRPPILPEPKADPMAEITKTLALVKTMREAMGMSGGAPQADSQSAALLARLEAMEKHRAEMRDLEERWERKAKEREEAALKRGREEGEKDAAMRFERRIWELERDLERAEEANPKTDTVDKIVSMVGGPQAVQGIVGTILSAANKPAPARPMPAQARPMPRPAPRPMQPQPQALPAPVAAPAPVTAPVAANPAPLPEPSPEEVAEALETIQAALEAVQASPEAQNPDMAQVAQGFAQCLTEGHQAKGQDLASWWAWINTPNLPTADGRKITTLDLAAMLADETEEGEDMTTEELKALLVQRLQEGKTTPEILKELEELVSDSTRAEWRRMMSFMPMIGILGFLGIPEELRPRCSEVLEAFQK